MIQYVTGTLGHGKTLYAARRMGKALLSGRCVFANMKLVEEGDKIHGKTSPGWQHIILNQSLHYKTASRKKKEALKAEIDQRYMYLADYDKMLAAGVDGFGEGRALRVFDEAHRKLNNRNWKDIAQNAMLEDLSVARHRGFDDLVVSQHAKNTDVAIRRIADSEVRLVDWQKVLKVPVFGAPILPFHWFLAQTFPVEESAVPGVQKLGKRTGFELFRLGWFAWLYDTYEEYDPNFKNDGTRPWLPKRSVAVVTANGNGDGHPVRANGVPLSKHEKQGALGADLHPSGKERLGEVGLMPGSGAEPQAQADDRPLKTVPQYRMYPRKSI